jgi:hypothetical protein
MLENWNDEEESGEDKIGQQDYDLEDYDQMGITTTTTRSIREQMVDGIDRIQGEVNLFKQLTSGISKQNSSPDDVIFKLTGFKTNGLLTNLKKSLDSFTQTIMNS